MVIFIPVILIVMFFEQLRVFAVTATLLSFFGYLLYCGLNPKGVLNKTDKRQNRMWVFLAKGAGKHPVFRVGLIFFCMVALVFTTVAGISYIPKDIQQEFLGVEFAVISGTEQVELQHVTVRISGRLHQGMFVRNPRFQGFIELDAYPDTIGREVLMHFSGNFDDSRPFSFGHLRYERLVNGHIVTDMYATFHAADVRFSAVVILIEPMDGSSLVGRSIIVAPAVDLETAENIMASIGIGWDGGLSFY